MLPLPIDPLLPQILSSLSTHRNLVLTAEPGGGKTTRVPSALLGLGGEVWVLEPRRMAARLAARRVAEELGERVGETVGYQVRFEEVAGPRTRLRFVTEGVLARRVLRDGGLAGVATVVLDEFHERHLETDLAFALLRRLQATTRADLRLVIMSATVDAEALATALDGCPALHAPGQVYPLEVSYRGVSAESLEEQVASAVVELWRGPGDVLVFLPGAAEIRRAMQALERRGIAALPLHGDLSAAEQDRAVAWTAEPKVICSTNIAESSVTLPGVRAVVDSGLARVAEYSPWSGLGRLRVARVSQASATQRAGRAARLGPGRVIRLYPEADFLRRPKFETPEIRRADWAGTELLLRAAGLGVDDLPWLERPPEAAVESARELLTRLQAIEGDRVTEAGREMAGYPVHPRLGRALVEARRRGVLGMAAEVVAALSLGERLPQDLHRKGRSDLLELAERQGGERRSRMVSMLTRGVKRERAFDENALLESVLAGYADRAARRRSKGSNELLLASGGAGSLAEPSVVRDAEFLVAVDVEERDDRSQPVIRLASAIEPEWLLDLYPERVVEEERIEWNKRDERVVQTSLMRFDQLVLSESQGAMTDVAGAARLLAAKAMEAGVARFVDAEELQQIGARVALVARARGIELPEDLTASALEALASGWRSFAELKKAAADGGFSAALVGLLPQEVASQMERLAPTRLRLPSGRNAKITYPADGLPYVASRLQDFFGMMESPKILGGQMALLVHLLAPNQRPVQVTQDLAGFWQRLYPQVRKELMRRYPRHAWPENPSEIER